MGLAAYRVVLRPHSPATQSNPVWAGLLTAAVATYTCLRAVQPRVCIGAGMLHGDLHHFRQAAQCGRDPACKIGLCCVSVSMI